MSGKSVLNTAFFFFTSLTLLFFFKESDLFKSEIRLYLGAFTYISDLKHLFITAFSFTGSSEPGFWLLAYGLLQLFEPETVYRIMFGGAIALICFSVSFADMPFPSKLLTFVLLCSNIAFLYLIDDQFRGTVALAFLMAFLYTGRRGFLFLAPLFHLGMILFIGCLYMRLKARYVAVLAVVGIVFVLVMGDLLAAKAVYFDRPGTYEFGFVFFVSCLIFLCAVFQYNKNLFTVLTYTDAGFFVKVFFAVTFFALINLVTIYDRYYVYMYVTGLFCLRYFFSTGLASLMFYPLVPVMAYQTLTKFNDNGLMLSVKPPGELIPYLPVLVVFFCLFLFCRKVFGGSGKRGLWGFRENVFEAAE